MNSRIFKLFLFLWLTQILSLGLASAHLPPNIYQEIKKFDEARTLYESGKRCRFQTNPERFPGEREITYYEMSADLGFAPAFYELGRIHELNSKGRDAVALRKAAMYYFLGVKKGHFPSFESLARLIDIKVDGYSIYNADEFLKFQKVMNQFTSQMMKFINKEKKLLSKLESATSKKQREKYETQLSGFYLKYAIHYNLRALNKLASISAKDDIELSLAFVRLYAVSNASLGAIKLLQDVYSAKADQDQRFLDDKTLYESWLRELTKLQPIGSSEQSSSDPSSQSMDGNEFTKLLTDF